jgi:phosphotransferase system  glucose/maltose/N-acetylglucosamine-specific IIC component
LFVISAIFGGLGFWALHMPLPAASIGLVLFILYSLVEMAMDPDHLFYGMVFRIVIAVALIRAIIMAVKARKLDKESEYLMSEGKEGN